MSATGRSDVRKESDFYETPAWCVRLAVEAIDLPTVGVWLDPGAGHGAIIKAVNQVKRGVDWDGIELRADCAQDLKPLVDRLIIGDFLEYPFDQRYVVTLGNPPFGQAEEFIRKCLAIADHTVLLLRLNFLSSEKRHDLFSLYCPDVYVLPNRPSFTGGGTDATEYAWFHWHDQPKSQGKIRVLPLTPRNER